MAAATVKNSFDENAENTVAIPREDSDLKSYVSYNYPQWHVKGYATWKDAKKAVYNGKADCMIMDSGMLEQYSDDNKLHSVFLEKYDMVSFAVRHGNSMLLSVLNRTIKTMSASKFSNAVYMYDSNLKKVTVMDGLEAARQIRTLNRKDTKEIPIIAMTANAFQDDIRDCIDAGMNAHIAKPIDSKK